MHAGLCFPPIQQESMPFAVVGSDKEYQVNGKRVLGRKTPWGIIEGNSVHLLEEVAIQRAAIKHQEVKVLFWDIDANSLLLVIWNLQSVMPVIVRKQ